MGTTVNALRQSQEVRSPDSIRRRPAKAELKKSDAVGSGPMESEFGLGPTIWDAIVRGHGSVKAAAFTMGKKDESQLKRQITNGTIRLKEFMQADQDALCEFAEWLLDTFKPARQSKRQQAIARLPELLALMLAVVTEGE